MRNKIKLWQKLKSNLNSNSGICPASRTRVEELSLSSKCGTQKIWDPLIFTSWQLNAAAIRDSLQVNERFSTPWARDHLISPIASLELSIFFDSHLSISRDRSRDFLLSCSNSSFSRCERFSFI